MAEPAVRLRRRSSFRTPTASVHALPAPGEAAATVVVWTCNHCPYALAWHDRLVDVARDYADRGVALPGGQLERRRALPGRLARGDARAGRARAIGRFPTSTTRPRRRRGPGGRRSTPHVFVLDADLRLRYEGAPDADHEDPSQDAAWLREALDAVLAGDEPEPPATEPVGCSIKWKD